MMEGGLDHMGDMVDLLGVPIVLVRIEFFIYTFQKDYPLLCRLLSVLHFRVLWVTSRQN